MARYNGSKRLEEREIRFSIPSLIKTAAASIGRSDGDVLSYEKLAEDGFNRTFRLTMNDGFEVIARLPHPSTQPKRLAIASEVATMNLIRGHGVPVPKVYVYSSGANNSVGSEALLGDVRFALSVEERAKILSEIVDVEAKLFGIQFPAYGSLFYNHDLPESMGREPLEWECPTEQFCVGPDVSLKFWHEERSHLKMERGPSTSALDVLQRAAVKEMAWLRAYGKPCWPYDRFYRDITDYQKFAPQEHIDDLNLFMEVAPRVVPSDEWLCRPVLRHPDLNPNNIFVSDDFQITGMIE